MCAARVLLLFSAAVAAQPIVHTSLGPVAGKIMNNNVKAFIGIPYAADTGGARRFLAPADREPWSTTRQAVDFAPGCVQTGSTAGQPGADVPGDQSEDCLNVNVYTPLNSSEASPLPVFFFMHGGAFKEGWNVGPRYLYDASPLVAQEQLVAFVPNYRLEALGFLNIPDLDLDGNYGIQDQRFALTWVLKNAVAFGGDPARVTIAGQSAGAMSVGIHMVSPASKGLFQRAIMESNVGGFLYKTPEQQKSLAHSFLSYAGCSAWFEKRHKDKVVGCLQSLTTDQVRAATANASNSVYINLKSFVEEWRDIIDVALPWTPTISTDLPLQVQDAFSQGLQAKVPLLVGTNLNEGMTFIGLALGKHTKIVKGIEYPIVVDYLFGSDADKVKARYPSPGFLSDASPQIAKIVTDRMFKCGSQKLALHNSQAGVETYNYRYSHPSRAVEIKAYSPAIPALCADLTCHSTEIPSVFGSESHATAPSPLEISISHANMNYWGSFIRGGAPVAKGFAEWPAFNVTRQGLLLGDVVKQESEADLCEFWDSIGYPRMSLPEAIKKSIADTTVVQV